jgi:alanyl-tRNA synthetase
VETATSGDQVDVVVNQTPFYGESGGQMGDQGTISGEGYQLEVSDTQKRGEGLFVHRAKVVSGTVSKGGRGAAGGRSFAAGEDTRQSLCHPSVA